MLICPKSLLFCFQHLQDNVLERRRSHSLESDMEECQKAVRGHAIEIHGEESYR